MSCDICGRGACMPSFHSHEEQAKYEKVIEAFDRARDLRDSIRNEPADEQVEEESAPQAEGGK